MSVPLGKSVTVGANALKLKEDPSKERQSQSVMQDYRVSFYTVMDVALETRKRKGKLNKAKGGKIGRDLCAP